MSEDAGGRARGAASHAASPGEDAGRRGRALFPRLRWVALVWLLVWAPSYAAVWGPRNFLLLCDVAVFLTALGLWRGSPLLLSSQAISSVVIDSLWTLDVAWRAVAGRHLIGGTEYMWDATQPLVVRLMSLFHIALPILVVACLRRREVGFDLRGLPLQMAIAVVILTLSRLVGEADKNPNFAFRDPFFGREWGPPLVHVGFIASVLIAAVYVPTAALLARLLPRARRSAARDQA